MTAAFTLQFAICNAQFAIALLREHWLLAQCSYAKSRSSNSVSATSMATPLYSVQYTSAQPT